MYSESMSTTEHTAKCLRCGRVRHFRSAAAAANSAPVGRVCAAKIRKAAVDAVFADFTPAQREKAAELIRDGGLVPTSRPGVFRTVGSKGDVTYLTHSAACSCPGGLRGRTACYHSLAVRVVMATGKAA
jgi:predicted nucleic acid-binding Zn finger protein